jgi:flagellar biosynthesis protein FlhF
MPASSPSPASGTYRFSVRSTGEAVALIRDRLGPDARVLSVRAVPAVGWRRYFCRPRLEIVAQVEAPRAPGTADGRARFEMASRETASPDALPGKTESPPVQPFRADNASSPATSARDLPALLRRSGLTEMVLERLQREAGWADLNRLPLHRALAETSRLLRERVESRADRPALTRAAFLGAAGVGRTTVLCKLLAQEIFRRARMGHVVAVEFDRANPLGPLPVFSEALGVPLAHFPCETRPALPGGFVFFDLPGMSSGGGAANASLAHFLEREAIEQRVLVLNAAYDRAPLREAYAAGRALGATHVVFTHLDEVRHWGKLWDYLFDETLEPLFLATGPSLTGDWEEDVTGAIARRTLRDGELRDP